MITLTVTQFNGAPYAGTPLSARFGPAGGTIGRADNNLLTLPDPEKSVSRVHVEVQWRAGQFVLVNRGANTVGISGQALTPGQEATVAGGEEVLIGACLLRVDREAEAPPAAAAAARDDPFVALFGAGAVAGGARDVFANPLAPPPPAPPPAALPAGSGAWDLPVAARPSSPPAFEDSRIPDDWDPLAPAGRTAVKPRSSAALNRPEASLDSLFNLQVAPGGADPLFGSALSSPVSAPNTSADADPMRAFGLAPPIPAASAADIGSDLYSPMPLPRVVPASPAAPVPPTSPDIDLDLSWGDAAESAGMRTIVRPAGGLPPAAASAIAALVASAPAPASAPVPAVQARPVAAPADSAADSAAPELLAALRRGLQLDDSVRLQMTPELMELVGGLLREAVQGSIDLLKARAALKREVRANVTIIAERENNPLKFSASVQAALPHLLGEPVRGYVPPLSAMRDAFADLRAHQFGVMAGMRAALDGVLSRFEPAQLEARLTPPSMLASLLPAGRKARLWELFNELFHQLRSEASDDFHELFGRAFLQAYEQYIDELQRSTP